MKYLSRLTYAGVLAAVLGWHAPPVAQPIAAQPGTAIDARPGPSVAGTVRDVLPDGWIVLDGDIGVPGDFFANRANYVTNLWTDGVVPFEFNPFVNQASRDVTMAAIAEWEAVANIQFRQRELFDLNYVRIHNNPADFNISLGIGMMLGQQDVFIHDWEVRTLIHELGHVLGFWHEQQRSNRDQFIQIFPARILDVEETFNFSIVPGSRHYGPYDFLSIMHYRQCAFSTCADCAADLENCRTMLIIDPDDRALFQDLFGTVEEISEWDARVMQWMYPPSNWRFVDGGYSGTEHGTLIEPWDTLAEGVQGVPTGGVLWVMTAGTYAVPNNRIDRAMVLRAPMGGVTLQ